MTEPYSAAGGTRAGVPADSPPGMIANGAGLVWAHGGGFAGGDLDMPEADGVARALAARGSHRGVGRLLARAAAAGAGPISSV